MSFWKTSLVAAAICYVLVAVGIDHFFMGIPLSHTLMDPLNFIGSMFFGLPFGWFFMKRR